MITNDDRTGVASRPRGGPAFGPRPQLVLPTKTAEELVLHNSQRLTSDVRKFKAWCRFLIYTEAYELLILDKIWEQHSDKETRARLASYVDLSINLALDITRDVAVVWKHEATRHIRGAGTRANEAFLELVRETKFSAIAPSWNRQAWFLGPIIVLPVMRSGRMTFDTLLPHFYEVLPDPNDPWGNPLAACWDVATCDPIDVIAYGEKAPKAGAVLVDGDSYRYYSVKDRATEVGRKSHSLGEFPGSALRFDTTHATAWWGCDRNQRLVDATINLGILNAKLGFVRKEQNKKQLVFKGDLGGMPKGQKHDPETAIQADAQNPEVIDIDAVDFDTSPENFIAHANWIIGMEKESFGAERDEAGRWIFSHEALTEIRNEQIPYAREFEADVWAKTVATAKANRHRLADKLPSPEAVRDGFEVRYEKLSRTFASPSEETAYKVHELSHGLIEHADMLATDFPHLSLEERRKMIMAKIEAQGDVFDAMAKRDQRRAGKEEDPKLQTAAQINGAEGPKVRDGVTPEREEDDDNE